ncbi:MAG: hypothetical protein IKW48_06550 [Akkermansia sp.]|nr:hypothetical protein [Akkermansia sp.]
MKTINSIIITCAAAIVFSSCGSIVAYINPDSWIPDPSETPFAVLDEMVCDMEKSKGSDKAIAKADALAPKMRLLQEAIERVRDLEIEFSTESKNAYNNILARIQKHDYFGSDALREAMIGARPL